MDNINSVKQRTCELSVIVPFYNETENIDQLYRDILRALEPLQKSFEIIFVDDGSSDDGARLVEEMARRDGRVRLISFTKNYGQTAAMAAGFKLATGKIYIAIDADNQNDPADISKLISKLDEGFDVASGWRFNRQDKFITRRLPSLIANWLLAKVTGVKLHDFGCSLKAYRAEFIDSISLYGEMHRFLPAYAQMVGARVCEVVVGHRARLRGVSKYGLMRTIKVLIDLVTVKFLSSYLTKPSYVFSGLGMLMCIFGSLSATEVLLEKFISGTFAHRNPFLLLAVFLFMIGVQMILMGLLAELQIRTYHESQGKPIYLIRNRVNI